MFENSKVASGHSEFVEKVRQQDNKFTKGKKYSTDIIPTPLRKFYSSYNPEYVDAKLKDKSQVSMYPLRDLESLQAEYGLGPDKFVFATKGGDPVFLYKGSVMSEPRIGGTGIPNHIANSFDEYLGSIGKSLSKKASVLTTDQRDSMSSGTFGLPSERKYPLNDVNHVRSALRYFNSCPSEKREELMGNIRAAAKRYGVTVENSEKAAALREEFEPIVAALTKLAWIGDVVPALAGNEAAQRLAERVVRKTTRAVARNGLEPNENPNNDPKGNPPDEYPNDGAYGPRNHNALNDNVESSVENLPYYINNVAQKRADEFHTKAAALTEKIALSPETLQRYSDVIGPVTKAHRNWSVAMDQYGSAADRLQAAKKLHAHVTGARTAERKLADRVRED